MNKILSLSHLDPNTILERQGRIFRKVIITDHGRWQGLDQFVLSIFFSELMRKGWIPRHDLEHPIRDDWNRAIYYSVDRIRHFTSWAWWTKTQYAAALRLIAEINGFLEHSGWLAADCHMGNVTFLHSRPVYIDVGSFSKFSEEMARVHMEWGMNEIGLPMSDSWSGIRQTIDSYNPPEYTSTEWDSYDKNECPDSLDQIRAIYGDETLLMDWINGLGLDVLDVGCNRGRLARLFATHGYEVVAVDLSAKCVDECWGLARKFDLPITSLCLDLLHDTHPLEPLACDVVIASSLTHHLFRQGADWFAQERLFRKLTRKWLLLEQVTPEDKAIQPWNLDGSFSTKHFEEAFREWGVVAEACPELPSRRWLKLRVPEFSQRLTD